MPLNDRRPTDPAGDPRARADKPAGWSSEWRRWPCDDHRGRQSAVRPYKVANGEDFRPAPVGGGACSDVGAAYQKLAKKVEQLRKDHPELSKAQGFSQVDEDPLNRDLVVAGAILHDMGRVLELGAEPVSPQPTVPGRLLGHLLLGRDLVRDTARDLGDVNPEMVQLLEHLILTHLELPAWGSPRLPLVPEVLIVHHADDLDAKLEMYARCLSRDTEAGPFTARDAALGRRLFKGRSL